MFNIFVHFAVARNHLLMQKRDSKSFDVVALHKNQLHEEDYDDDDTAFVEKTHQSLDYSLYNTDAGNGSGGNGNDAAGGIPIDSIRNMGINGNANRMNDEQSNGDIGIGAVGGTEVTATTTNEVK